MNFFKKLSEYLKDNPEGYWFKRKLYGWGWVPVKWQGFVVIAVYLIIILSLAFSLDENATDKEVSLMLVLPLIILTALLIRICYKKGEKPRWQWGIPKKD